LNSTGTPVFCKDRPATRRLARKTAAALRKGDAVLFYGDLGAGKTFFVKEACARLGIPKDAVTSPSFTIVRTYRAENGASVHHIDLYRLTREAETDFFEMDDYCDDNSIIFVEWADRLKNVSFPGRVISITISIRGKTEREFRIEPWIL
jgi:tRNA threonylcarbamoyladenosine biosynthesis protein TsaE